MTVAQELEQVLAVITKYNLNERDLIGRETIHIKVHVGVPRPDHYPENYEKPDHPGEP